MSNPDFFSYLDDINHSNRFSCVPYPEENFVLTYDRSDISIGKMKLWQIEKETSMMNTEMINKKMEIDPCFNFEILKFPSFFVIASLKYDISHQCHERKPFFNFMIHSSKHPFQELKNFKIFVSRMSIIPGDPYFGVMDCKEEDLIWVRLHQTYMTNELYIISVSKEKITRCVDVGSLYRIRSLIVNSRKYPNVIYIPREQEKRDDTGGLYHISNWGKDSKEIVSFDLEKEKMIRIVVTNLYSFVNSKMIVSNKADNEFLMVLITHKQLNCHDVISGKLISSYILKERPYFCIRNRFLFFKEEKFFYSRKKKNRVSKVFLQLLDVQKGEFIDLGNTIPIETHSKRKKFLLVGMMIHRNQFVVIYQEKVSSEANSYHDLIKEDKEILYTRIFGTEEIIIKKDKPLLEERVEYLIDSTINNNLEVFPLNTIFQIYIQEKEKINSLKSFICI